MFDAPLGPNDKMKHMAHLIAEYFDKLESWLNQFDQLVMPAAWEDLYATLVDKLSYITNSESGSSRPFIHVDQVLMPTTAADIFKLCRLLFQALVPLWIAVPDGQHRIAAMVELLAGWTIAIKPLGIPPKGFEPSDHHGLVSPERSNWSTHVGIRDDFKELLKKMSGKVTARVMVPTSVEMFEHQCIEYSRFRDESQSRHKPRVLVDV
jgi:hypothetical protein